MTSRVHSVIKKCKEVKVTTAICTWKEEELLMPLCIVSVSVVVIKDPVETTCQQQMVQIEVTATRTKKQQNSVDNAEEEVQCMQISHDLQ